MSRKTVKARIAVVDSETDPFEHGAEIKPFTWGFYDGKEYVDFWDTPGIGATVQLAAYLESRRDPLVLYAHNGGKFDFMFFLQAGMLDTGEMLLINGRIVKAKIGIHELRDSYAIIPVALDQYQKVKFDYQKIRRDVRARHKKEILAYQKSDCLYLYDLVSGFVNRFGPKLTVGATAIHQLSQLHPVIRLGPEHDAIFRPYYFGGRVQYFEAGALTGDFKIYDVNSMYPAVMKNAKHPIGREYIRFDGADAEAEFNRRTGKLRRFPSSPYFIRFIGEHGGCLPVRTKDDGLSFAPAIGEFHVCSHEMEAGIELGLIRVAEVLEIHVPNSYVSFDKYVDKFGAEKVEAKTRKNQCDAAGDEQGALTAQRDELFAKFMLNSAYGKFATNPENFKCWYMVDTMGTPDDAQKFNAWRNEHDDAELEHDLGRFEIWTCPAKVSDNSYFDVATAASITSAARAVLMRAIENSNRPIYCDTDSLICEGLTNCPIDDKALGAWKLEKTADTLFIAGRKQYAAFNSVPQFTKDKDGREAPVPPIYIGGAPRWCVKLAAKGARLTPADMIELCEGKVIEWQSQAPAFKLDGSSMYVSRKIKARFLVDAEKNEA